MEWLNLRVNRSNLADHSLNQLGSVETQVLAKARAYDLHPAR